MPGRLQGQIHDFDLARKFFFEFFRLVSQNASGVGTIQVYIVKGCAEIYGQLATVRLEQRPIDRVH